MNQGSPRGEILLAAAADRAWAMGDESKARRPRTFCGRSPKYVLMQAALTLHVLAELVAGILLLFSPAVFLGDTATYGHLETARGFGNGAISIALLGAVLLFRHSTWPDHGVVWGFAILAQYHAVIIVVQLREPNYTPAMKALVSTFHGLMSVVFAATASRALPCCRGEEPDAPVIGVA